MKDYKNCGCQYDNDYLSGKELFGVFIVACLMVLSVIGMFSM